MEALDLAELEGQTVFKVGSDDYTRNDLMSIDLVSLRALFRERVHHSIEVPIYPIILGRKKMPGSFGMQVELLFDICLKRGFDQDEEDFIWGKKYINVARRMRAGEKIGLDFFEEALPEAFSNEEMQVVRKLIWERKSVRDFVVGKPVPDHLITEILEAGRAAPTGCNLDVVRFIVIRDPEEAKMVWSDISTPMDSCVLIVLCYDTRPYHAVGHDVLVPHNMMYDAAAAGDHMCLMAHALGLGAVWLSCTDKTALRFQENYGLPLYIKQAMHLAVGYTAIGSLKSLRMPLKEMILSKDKI